MAPPPTQASALPVSARLLQIAKTAQFSWWLGHVTTLIFGTLCFLKYFFNPSASRTNYYIAFVGACVSYGISVYKTYGPPQLTLPFLQRLIIDENVQYIVLAVFFYTQSPILVTLVPYYIFSIFHTSSYFRLTIIPLFFPKVVSELENARNAAPGTSVQLSLPAQISRFLGTRVSSYYSIALKVVSIWEIVVVFVWVSIGALSFRISFFSPIIYIQFLRLRYVTSPQTRTAFSNIRAFLDSKLTPPTASPKIPPSVTKYYVIARNYIITVGDQLTNTPSRQN
ncbi:Tetra-spanning protein 1 [Smittium mucronatum]|uniref:Tetra-spanning protein 1 n=1 Tax=Smittium mucronatum TaxID=133383 RepID=A0A1R0H0K1_9FUNG|nr:Tetra-spanning protein 1 [Smittium mucronatum]